MSGNACIAALDIFNIQNNCINIYIYLLVLSIYIALYILTKRATLVKWGGGEGNLRGHKIRILLTLAFVLPAKGRAKEKKK